MLKKNDKLKAGEKSVRTRNRKRGLVPASYSYSKASPFTTKSLVLKHSTHNIIPTLAIVCLSVLSITALCPVGINSISGLGSNDVYATGTATVGGWLSSSVKLELEDTIAKNVIPTVDGSFAVLSTVAHVVVSNSDYYNVTIAGEEDMTGIDGYAGITGITAAKAGNSFDRNEWGYTITKNETGSSEATVADKDTTYERMTSTGTNVPTGSSSTSHLVNGYADDYYSLNFAAKVDTSIPADTYSSNVVLSVVASPKLVTGFDRTDTMQGLTSEICREIGSDKDTSKYKYEATDVLNNTYYTKQLRDTRDGKLYWVAKLKSSETATDPDAGNCWMVQNLALDLTTTTDSESLKTGEATVESGAVAILTPEDSNVTEDWIPEYATRTPDYPERFTITGCTSSDNYGGYGEELVCLDANAGYSWNEGKYVLFYPLKSNSSLGGIGFTAAQGGLSAFASSSNVASTPSDMKAPASLGGGVIVKIDDSWIASIDPEFTVKSTYKTTNGETADKITGQAIDATNRVYDAHYLIGNYYQWLTATAQNVGKNILPNTGDIAEGSICPAGWQLPKSGASNNSNPTSFYNLIATYMALSGSTLTGGDTDGGKASLATNTNLEKVITGTAKFLRSGNIIPNRFTYQTRNVSSYSHWWSSVSSGLGDALYFHIFANDVIPSESTNRSDGFAVRCLLPAASN